MAKVFQSVGGIRPGRSVFDLSYEKKFDCDMGQLIPVMADEVVPGDVFKMSNQLVIRFNPLVAPVLHEINAYIHYFFVPNRLVMEDWEEFISGGTDGETTVPLPLWSPVKNGKYSLWDYFGLPVGVVPNGALPLSFSKRAYNLIWNEFYRDQNLQDEVDLDQEDILLRSWEKDYFTSALPWQQRGTAPALPISGTSSAVFDSSSWTGSVPDHLIGFRSSEHQLNIGGGGASIGKFKDTLDNNVVDLSSAATFDVSDLRLAFQVQKWMERNARAGVRYTEFLRSHFGVSPRDDRLQRPEYIGGSKSPVIVSEVLQTSSTDSTSPQGNLAGHGITADQSRIANYRATEFGWIIGLLSIMPRATYQQGIDRQYLKRSKYDFYFPEFAHLSEQAIEQAEIFATGSSSENTQIFGYQGRYDELRFKRSMCVADMRDRLDYWHLGRDFATPPILNSSFIECNPSKRIFAVQNVPGMVVNVANLITAIRPLPVIAEPGMIDHF